MAYRHQIKNIHTNKSLQTLLLSNSLILISLGMLVPVYALFVQKVGGGALSAGFTAGGLGLASAISALISGRLIDKFKPENTRYILVIGWGLLGATTLLYLLVKDVLILFVVQLIIGAVKTISSPAFDTLYARHLDKTSSGQEYGIWEASFFMTAGIGSVLGGIIVNYFGFNGLFLVMSLLCFSASGYILSLPKYRL